MFDYKNMQLPFEVLKNAVREKAAKLEELTLLKVRLWLVLQYFRNGNFREFWYWRRNFPVSERQFPVALVSSGIMFYMFLLLHLAFVGVQCYRHYQIHGSIEKYRENKTLLT